jgi:hypothetical protein
MHPDTAVQPTDNDKYFILRYNLLHDANNKARDAARAEINSRLDEPNVQTFVKGVHKINIKISNKLKEYRDINKEKMKEWHKEYREQNKDKIKEKLKKYYENNKEKIKATEKKYREQNKEKINEKRRERNKLKKETYENKI